MARTGSDLHASELHGLLVGYLCAVKDSSTPQQRKAIFESWLDARQPATILVLLEEIYLASLDSLDEFADFDFRLMIPSDDESISSRAAAIALWCSGFLSGFGETGRQLDADDASDVKEALQDIGRIAGMTSEVPEAEDNEADLTQIVEFVRISTLLIFAETGTRGAH